MAAETERRAIADLWPEHLPHLPPESNRMGQPYTDTEHGIICNCGDVLGWPKDVPAVEHRYDAAADSSAMAGGDPEDAVPLADPDPAYYSPVAASEGGSGFIPGPKGGNWDDPGDDLSEQEAAALVMSGAYGEPPDDVQEQAMATLRQFDPGDDPADEAQATYLRQPVHDVQLPAVGVTREQIDAAGEALARHDREGFHAALGEEPPIPVGTLPARRTDVVIPADPLDGQVMIIDPTLPYGPEDVERQLLRTENQLERGMHFQRYWEERQYHAKVAFTLANARALVRATGGDAATRKAQALLDCESEYLEMEVCDTMVRSARECMHTLRSLQTGYQTLSNSVGAVMRSRPQGA
jgi:hypothetical protein